MVHIANFTEFKLQICNCAQKRRICRDNCKCAFDEHFHGHFCPRRKAAKFCHPGLKWWRRRKRKTTSAWGNQALIILAGCNQALIVSEVLGRESDAIVLNNTLIEGIVQKKGAFGKGRIMIMMIIIIFASFSGRCWLVKTTYILVRKFSMAKANASSKENENVFSVVAKR